MNSVRNIAYILILGILFLAGKSNAQKRITVSQDGKGDFTSIQAAVSSLQDSSSVARVIFIKKGTYREKLYIEKHNLVLEGESREQVIITASINREEWRCMHGDDWGVATLNIDGSDITLKNLTVANMYGYEIKNDRLITCAADTANPFKKISPAAHQMAVRTMNATRFAAVNCIFKSYAGDTMSPWNVRAGMFYFKDCIMEGGVDLYCPRGWAYAENCTFIALRGDAIIWHDGSADKDSKSVFNHCTFEGYDGFQLGRYHRDAQFFLFNCTFAKNMADKAIYQVPAKNNVQWGHRVYFFNCHKSGGDYAWHADTISASGVEVDPSGINAGWVFGNKWNPLKKL